MKPRVLIGWMLLALLLAPLQGREEALPIYPPGERLTGKLTAAGTDSMAPMMRRWVELFRAAQPGVEFHLETGAPPTAAAGLAAGTADIGYTGRTLWAPEVAAIVQRQGNPPRSFIIAAGAYADRNKTHTMAVFVRASNSIVELPLAEVRRIFSADVSDSSWHPYVAKLGTGATNAVQQALLGGAPWGRAVREFPTDEAAVAALAEDPAGICIAGLPYGTPTVRALALGAGDHGPFFPPTLANVVSRHYPLARLLYFHVNEVPGQPLSPVLREFLRFVLSREGQVVAAESGYLPLTAELARQELAKLR
jgi:phosphate transport system substrate-binding protein